MLLWVTVGRWVYSEAQLSAPVLVPVFDSILEVVRIPTHDTWSFDGVNYAIGEVREILRSGQVEADTLEVSSPAEVFPSRDFDLF